MYWRRGQESNLSKRICNPLHNRFATAPCALRSVLVRQIQNSGAGNETRTRDLNLGKVALYQLSYSRVLRCFFSCFRLSAKTEIIGRELGGYQAPDPTLRMKKAQCFTASTPVTGLAASASGTTLGSSSGKGCGWLTKANSSTLSIHFTGTISRWFLTFSGMS